MNKKSNCFRIEKYCKVILFKNYKNILMSVLPLILFLLQLSLNLEKKNTRGFLFFLSKYIPGV